MMTTAPTGTKAFDFLKKWGSINSNTVAVFTQKKTDMLQEKRKSSRFTCQGTYLSI